MVRKKFFGHDIELNSGVCMRQEGFSWLVSRPLVGSLHGSPGQILSAKVLTSFNLFTMSLCLTALPLE